MTTIQYVSLMLHWFGDGIITHPGLAEKEYQDAIRVLLPLTEQERYEIAHNPEWKQP